ncbi:MAG: RNA polymerase sigma factor [Propionibacteriaceae bacterium]|nr:RNA polymerase sigma factor [Propionibacteriaceae bacterium]
MSPRAKSAPPRVGVARDPKVVDRFTDLYTEHYPRVVAYAKRRVGDLSSAEDIAADVFRIAWEKTGTSEAFPNAGWLFATARHTVLHHHRSTARADALAQTAAQEATRRNQLQADEDGQIAQVRVALAELPPEQRELLMAYYLDGLSGAECGAILGCSTGAVWVRLHRARSALKDRFNATTAVADPTAAPTRGGVGRTRDRVAAAPPPAALSPAPPTQEDPS